MKSRLFMLLVLFAFVSFIANTNARAKYTKFIHTKSGSYHGAKMKYNLTDGRTVIASSYDWTTTTVDDFTTGTSTSTTVVEGVLDGTSGTFTSIDGGKWVWEPGGKLPRECEENENNSLTREGLDYYIYPNPAINNIKIMGELSENAKIDCFSMTGENVSTEINNVHSNIDVSHLTSGDYLLVINSYGNINAIKFKIIK